LNASDAKIMADPVQYDYLPTPIMPRLPPQKLLLGQKALVTGASSGSGRAVALSLGEAGAGIVVNFVSGAQQAQEVADEIREKGSDAIAIRADVADEAQVASMFAQMCERICPGAIRTPINMEAWDTAAAYQELMKFIPCKRIGDAAEIGRAAVWLASDYADYVHSISLFADGGMTLYPGFETGG